MDSDDEYEGDDGVITLHLTRVLQGAKEVYDRERPSTRNASTASRASNRVASQQTVRLVLDHVKAAPTSFTESTEVETFKENVSRYIACLNTILNSLIAGKKRTDALERNTVPESLVADLTAKYDALKLDQTTLSEAIPLIQAGKGIVQIATQLGMPVGCEFHLSCLASGLLTNLWVDDAEYDQSCLETGRSFRTKYDTLIQSSGDGVPSVNHLVALFHDIYSETEGIDPGPVPSPEETRGSIDSILMATSADPYAKLREALSTACVAGTIARKAGAVEVATSIAKAFGIDASSNAYQYQ